MPTTLVLAPPDFQTFRRLGYMLLRSLLGAGNEWTLVCILGVCGLHAGAVGRVVGPCMWGACTT